MIGLRLIPYVLDEGEVAAASGLLREAETALASVNRSDEFYAPLAELRRSQLVAASGDVGDAAAMLLDLIPDDVESSPRLGLVIEEQPIFPAPGHHV